MAIGPRIGARIGARVGPRIGSPAGSAPAAGPTVSRDKGSYTAAENLQATFSGSTSVVDWLNIVLAASADNTTGNYVYCSSGLVGVPGGVVVPAGTYPIALTALPAGTYEVRFMVNDTFVVAARSATFTVT